MPRFCQLVSAALSTFAFGAAADFPTASNSGEAMHLSRPAMTAENAVATFTLPAGFSATVFAAEPDVQNPIGLSWDGRGRLWVAENYTYAERGVRFDANRRDRVLVFTESPEVGRFAKRQVFIDTVQRLTSVEVGLGGVWLMCPPQLLFVPDRDGDAVPDGPAEVVLDGFTPGDVNYHNFANGLRFGPDGWLYGRCGASIPGELGRPGTPASERIPLRGTMWRYHPQRRVVEVLGGGTTNPWGHDWDAFGELFFINTVNGHLWHAIPGAHFTRAHTIDPNPHVYELIDHHADHWHFDTSRTWQDSRDGAANALGGGHAHVGMMIYQGTNWPTSYRGGLFTLNFHGRRINHEALARRGSGYVGRHEKDFLIAGDPWFRGIELTYGPDGGVYVLDWSDTGECHNSTGVNRTSGRIYKIVYGTPERVLPDMDQTRGRDLVALQISPNEWLARQARLELTRRSAAGQPLTHAVEELTKHVRSNEVATALRALWALNAVGAASPELLRSLLPHESEHVRSWAIRLLTETWPLDTVMGQRPPGPEVVDAPLLRLLEEHARTDSSAHVRLTLASVLQRIAPGQRVGIAAALASRTEDRTDHNLPLMLWYALIPVARDYPGHLVRVAEACEWPTTRRLIARRLGEEIEARPAALNDLLALARPKSDAFKADVLEGLSQALMGWRRAVKPAAWDALVAAIGEPEAPRAARLRELNVVFGDGRALSDVKALALDPKVDVAVRKTALQSLIDARPPDLREVCERGLRVRFLNATAVKGLVLFDDPAIAELIASAYHTFFHPSERHLAIDALVSRPSFARVLLEQIASGKLPRTVITPAQARQLRSFNDAAIHSLLSAHWGQLRDSARDKEVLMASYRTELTSARLANGNKSAGRALFNQLCSSCHKLYGEGQPLGPDLTGAGRDSIEYLIENIADPSAVVTADFQMTILRLRDGRTLSGFVSSRTSRTVTVRNASETQTVERTEIAGEELSTESVMPAGLLETLSPDQRRDLIAYLMHRDQVPLP